MSDNLLLRGQPDRSLLNRHEKWEVDYFVNQFASKHGRGSAAVAQKARRMLAHVPSNLRSHSHVEQWLISNWAFYV